MYTRPATAEQCLHNALKVVNALRFIGVDYDIQAIDITDPNPISLMLLVMHLYHSLPQYIPKSTVEFVGPLHALVLRQVSRIYIHVKRKYSRRVNLYYGMPNPNKISVVILKLIGGTFGTFAMGTLNVTHHNNSVLVAISLMNFVFS